MYLLKYARRSTIYVIMTRRRNETVRLGSDHALAAFSEKMFHIFSNTYYLKVLYHYNL
jgi:hypothetical protein